MKKNILLLVISTVIVLTICELFIRILFPQINTHDAMFQFDESLGWEFIPNKKGTIVYEGGIDLTVQVNEDGYRDAPFRNKNEDTKVMVLGDSFVSNISVEDDEVFTQVMEDQLADTSIYNLGVNGYGQIQEYLVLKEWYPKLQPDLIMVLIYLRNDFTDNMGKNPWLYPRPTAVFDTDVPVQIIPPSKEYKTKKKLPFYYKSHLYRFVKKSLSNIKSKTVKGDHASYTPPEVYTCRYPMTEESKELYDTMQHMILEIHQYGKNNNTPVIFALAPSMVQVESNLWSEVTAYDTGINLQNDLPNATLSAFAKANNISMVDLMPALKKAQYNGVKMYNPQEQHWTTEGNKVVADVLTTYVQEIKTKPQDSL